MECKPGSGINLFKHVKPLSSLLISVIIPVRNEADNLYESLDALRRQVADKGNFLPKKTFEVLLLANNCSDNSFEIAKRYGSLFPDFQLVVAEICLPQDLANIGTVRRLLMDEACARLISVGNQHGIIASTDGDSAVSSTWIYEIIKEIKNGNDAVGGRIITRYHNTNTCNYYHQNEVYRNLVARAESLIDPRQHDPWPSHYQYYGASLAVTCSMYLQVGGLPRLPHLEDEALHKALILHDAKVRKSPRVQVITSDRHEGRVSVGFSQQLREWDHMRKINQPQLVTSAEELVTKFTYRRQLREIWLLHEKHQYYNPQNIVDISNELALNSDWLMNQLTTFHYFGRFWEQVEEAMSAGEWGKKWNLVDISIAIKGLQNYETSDTQIFSKRSMRYFSSRL